MRNLALFTAVLLLTIDQAHSNSVSIPPVVTTAADELDTPSGAEISLREAIRDSATGDTITFDTNLNGQTVLLSSGQIEITKNLTIDASNLSNGITINANQASRIIEILPGLTVDLRGLTLTGGMATGSFPANSGGAIYNNQSTLSLNACTLSSNSADSQGGGIFNNGSVSNAMLSLNSCTLSGNSADSGGGISSDGSSGGSATLNLSNCTLAGNSANSGGGILSDGSSGGNATLDLSNTILAGNTAATGPDVQEFGTTITPVGMNLLSSTAGSDMSPGANIIVQPDPQLAPLGLYGGPTQTIHPLAGSPAILTDSTTRTDQRGFTLTGPTTIGAVKIGTTTTVSDETTLRSALAASTNSEGKIIRFDPSLTGDTITLTSGQLAVPSTANGLFIDASNLSNGLTINANGKVTDHRVMEILPNATAALHGLTLTGGMANLGGAISNNQSRLSLSNCTLAGNSAFQGGAIFNDGFAGSATLSLNHCTLANNFASSQGGGIYSDGLEGRATLSLNDCTLSGNSANFGGGVLSDGFKGRVTLSLRNTILAGNTATTGPDVRETGNATTTAFGMNLLSSIDGSNIPSPVPTGITISQSPQLAPLGDYGGPTQTMPPLPGSPAIDAVGTTDPGGTDQRGFPRFVGGALDIGAVEFQGNATELDLAFNEDIDRDGTSVGVELAIGTDPLLADPEHPNNLRLASFDEAGMPQFTFGLDNAQQANITLRLMRSIDLVTFNHEVTSNATANFVDPGSALLMPEDINPPAGGKAFYRLEAEHR